MIDWVFDLSAWDLTDPEEELWIIQTRGNTTPAASHANSSGRFVNRTSPIMCLRWTDRDLVALATD
jgi:hypothetical protein